MTERSNLCEMGVVQLYARQTAVYVSVGNRFATNNGGKKQLCAAKCMWVNGHVQDLAAVHHRDRAEIRPEYGHGYRRWNLIIPSSLV